MPRSDRPTQPQRRPKRRYFMSQPQSSPTRRDVLIAATAAGAATMIPPAVYAAAGDIRPFQIHFPDAALTDLRGRIAATKKAAPGRVPPGAPRGARLAHTR